MVGPSLFCKEIKRLSGYGITGYTAIENVHNAGLTNHRNTAETAKDRYFFC